MDERLGAPWIASGHQGVGGARWETSRISDASGGSSRARGPRGKTGDPPQGPQFGCYRGEQIWTRPPATSTRPTAI
eukprot:1181494-Prorocentrum_minimum.AAC.7